MPFKIVMVREVTMLLALINGKLQVQIRGVSIREGTQFISHPTLRSLKSFRNFVMRKCINECHIDRILCTVLCVPAMYYMYYTMSN